MQRAALKILLAFAVPLAFAREAPAQLENENLLVTVPAGYKIDFQNRKGNMLITEMVPSGETIKKRTEMVTVQVFFGLKVTPEQAKSRIEQGWLSGCPGSDSMVLGKGERRGYPSLMWVLLCPTNSSTGKPENTWFVGIQGNDSFYVVQKAYKFTPSKEQETKWLGYLRGVSVCDSRLPERACPRTKR